MADADLEACLTGEQPIVAVEDRIVAVHVSQLALNVASELSDGDRDALLLHAVGELSYREVSQTLGVPTGTVKSRIARARRAVKAALAQATPAAEGLRA